MATSQSHNPYVGPRPFEREEQNLFFGREREISELQSLLTAHRTLLLYAASGAGKTSLLNAGLLPLMEQEGFEVLPIARVRGLIPEGVRPEDISNPYVFNTLMSWTEDEAAHKTLARMSLAEFLNTREHILDSDGFSAPRLIIFDQFEELFTLYQQHWKQREDFFHQVAEALEQDPVLRVLFVMREDHLASLDPYVSLLPERLRARYRLVRLRVEDACRAVEGPLKGSKRSFADGVAARLVGELLKTKVESVIGETVEAVGEYVEPVQLQIVCKNLWDSLPADVTVITSSHLQSFGDVDEALKGFYEDAVQKTISETDVKEEKLRKWFARELITPAGTRGTVYRGKEDTHGIPNAAVDILENEHILRGELRAGAHWYELTHDRLIEPIRNSNEIWFTDYEAEQARLRARKKLRKYLFVGVVVLVVIAVSTIVSISIYSQAISQETSELEKSAKKGRLTDEKLRQLSSLTGRAQALQRVAKITGIGLQLERALGQLSTLIAQNITILTNLIDEISSAASALQEGAKGELTEQEFQELSSLTGRAETLKPAASMAGGEVKRKLEEVLDKLNSLSAQTPYNKADEIRRISQETSELEKSAEKGKLTDKQLQQLSKLIGRAQALQPVAKITESQLQEVRGRLSSLIEQNTPNLEDKIDKISQETSELEKSAKKGRLTDEKLRQLSSLTGRAETLKPAASMAGAEVKLKLEEVLGGLSSLIEQNTPNLKDKIHRISQEASALEKLVKRPKEELTKQELQQLQQLSSLIGGAETLRPAAKKAGVDSQLEEVLDKLNSLFAQNLKR